MKINGHTIAMSNAEKVFFPQVGLTKGDLMDYYQTIAGVMIPHLKHYPVSVQRFPDGLSGDGFYVKDAPEYFPNWMNTVVFPKKEGGSFDAPVVDDAATLSYLADQAVIALHRYLARADDLKTPDKMVYDLDPPKGTEDFDLVRQAALDIRAVMTELDLMCWVQTTGSQGYHVVIPLRREWGFDRVRDFARDVSLLLVRRHEDRYTLEHRKRNRQGRIYMDNLRNAYGATSVAPYSVRALEGAPVATPVTWEEMEAGASPQDWTMESIPQRLGQKDDPWEDIRHHAYDLESHEDDLQALLDAEPPAEEED